MRSSPPSVERAVLTQRLSGGLFAFLTLLPNPNNSGLDFQRGDLNRLRTSYGKTANSMTAPPTKQPDAGLKSPWTIAFVAIAMVLNSASAGEQSELDSAARQFRIRAYNRYRTNRVEYDRNIEKADQLLRRLKGGEISHAEAVRWLRGASQTVRVQQKSV